MKKIDPKTIAAATPEEIPVLVDRAKVLKAEIEERTAELKIIEIKLDKAAQTMPHETLKDEHREGRRVILNGTRWRLPVLFTSDALIQSFKEGSPKHLELLSILYSAIPENGADREAADAVDQLLRRFFDAPATWETKFDDGQKFRTAVSEWLPEAIAAKFLAACRQTDRHGIAKSKTVVAFDQAEAIKPEAVS